MKIILLILSLSLAGYFWFYPYYQLKQEEKSIRHSMQNIPNNATAHHLSHIAGYAAQAQVLNQYPKFLVYVMLKDYKTERLDPAISAFIRDFSCQGLNTLTRYPALKRNATLNLMQNDQHLFEYEVKNSFGKVLFKYQQRMQDCAQFPMLKSMKDEEPHQTTHDGSRYVSPETIAREKELSR